MRCNQSRAGPTRTHDREVGILSGTVPPFVADHGTDAASVCAGQCS